MIEGLVLGGIALAVLGVAVYRGEKAYREGAEATIRNRTRVVRTCFGIWGCFFALFLLVELATSSMEFAEQQGLAMLAGLLVLPAAVVMLVGLFHAAMVWRDRSALALVVASAVCLPFIFSGFFREPWTSLIAAGYAIFLISAWWRGRMAEALR